MSQRPYPEAIRGIWYVLREDEDLATVRDTHTGDIYLFRMDGSFSHVQLKNGSTRRQEDGSYTFDGEFLITRGRNTETYRVSLRDARTWEMETKKHGFTMHRSLYPEDAVTLTEREQRDLRILPIRAKLTLPHDSLGVALGRLEFEREGAQAPVILGEVCVELEQERRLCWIGLTARTRDLDASTWTRIAQESIWSMGLDDAQREGIDELELLHLDTNDFVNIEL